MHESNRLEPIWVAVPFYIIALLDYAHVAIDGIANHGSACITAWALQLAKCHYLTVWWEALEERAQMRALRRERYHPVRRLGTYLFISFRHHTLPSR